jgi:glycosyltransferase involved in cell wall biosynthesis
MISLYSTKQGTSFVLLVCQERGGVCMNKVLILVPVYNEEKNIGGVLDELKAEATFADILVINDGSVDNTVEVVNSYMQETDQIKMLTLIFNLGYSGALQTGFKYAVRNGYEYVIQFDGDGQHIAQEIDVLRDEMPKRYCDIVIGSRYFKGSKYRASLLRRWGAGLFSKVIRHGTKEVISDPTSGFQMLSKRVFSYYAQKGIYPNYPDANLLVDVIRRGFIIREVYVGMRPRQHGDSMHSSLISNIRYMVEVMYSVFIALLK